MNKLMALALASIFSLALVSTAYAVETEKTKKEVAEKQQEVREENAKVVDEMAHAVNKSMQEVSRASKIIGTKVTSATGESLGNIKDLVLDPESGQIGYAVVSFGGLLGVGNKLFALPWRALHWVHDKENYFLDIDKETLKKAPGFDKKHWPDSGNKWDVWRQETEQFYSISP
jgi:sporulation protein YlmC with PRC-barrel domain